MKFLVKTKIDKERLARLEKIEKEYEKALILLQAIQSMCRQSEQIDSGYHHILELLRESDLT